MDTGVADDARLGALADLDYCSETPRTSTPIAPRSSALRPARGPGIALGESRFDVFPQELQIDVIDATGPDDAKVVWYYRPDDSVAWGVLIEASARIRCEAVGTWTSPYRPGGCWSRASTAPTCTSRVTGSSSRRRTSERRQPRPLRIAATGRERRRARGVVRVVGRRRRMAPGTRPVHAGSPCAASRGWSLRTSGEYLEESLRTWWGRRRTTACPTSRLRGCSGCRMSS